MTAARLEDAEVRELLGGDLSPSSSTNVRAALRYAKAGYVIRVGEPLQHSFPEQAAESHFMIARICSAYLLGSKGLFQADAVGRLMFTGAYGDISWATHHDVPDESHLHDENVVRWYVAVCNHTFLRRAADDARLALLHPHEALIYVYRGFEWIKEGLQLGWEDIARDLGVPPSHMRDLKKLANAGTGVRHASKSGAKIRADVMTYATWVCGLFDAIHAARARVEPGYTPAGPDEVAQAVMLGVPAASYE